MLDAAMIDGASILMAMFHGMKHTGFLHPVRGTNMLDTGAHFYDTYETADGKFISIGSIEPQFYAELLEKTGLKDADLPHQMSRDNWSALKERLTEVFKQKTRAQWCELMEGSDVCFAPVLSLEESAADPHMQARNNFIEVGGVNQPAPAPRFSRTPPEVSRPPSNAGQDTDEGLAAWGVSTDEIARLRAAGAIG